MDDEIELINDGQGIALIGSETAINRFLLSEGLQSKELNLQRLFASDALSAGAAIAQSGSIIGARSGRWVKLTKDSAKAFSEMPLMKGSQPGTARAIVTSDGGKIKGILEIVRGPGAAIANPALLAGAAGIMQQIAMQQAMDEISDYLAVLDRKVDEVLRAQKDAVLADMIGVDFVIDEAMTIRQHVGRVSETSWSKVQGTSMTLARTQAYALRQLAALADEVERSNKLGDVADASKVAERTVHDWLAVLARCFQLQDAVAVLELDRVLDEAPDELDRHRVALRAARQNRLKIIDTATEQLLGRLDSAARKANAKVLLAPKPARVIVESSNRVAVAVGDLQGVLGVETSRVALDARRWLEAAGDVRDRVVDTGAAGVDAARNFGGAALNGAKTATGKLTTEMADRAARRRAGKSDQPAEEAE